jgi:hypothetical protein
MRRATDRIQALLRAVLLAVLVIGGPAATTYAGHAAYTSAMRSGHAPAAAWHQVPALILRVRPIATLPQSPFAIGSATLSVRWTPPNGPSRTGQITGRADTAPGSMMTVWIDKAGRLTAPPPTRAAVAEHVIGAVAATAAALALLLSAVSGAASLMLDRYRLARWEADWLAVEPHWTKGGKQPGAPNPQPVTLWTARAQVTEGRMTSADPSAPGAFEGSDQLAVQFGGARTAYGRDISHSCRSLASAACCSGSIVPAVLSAPNTGLRQPHEQAAWTLPSPSWWMVVWWSTAAGPATGERPGRSASASRRRGPGPGRRPAWLARRCRAPAPAR